MMGRPSLMSASGVPIGSAHLLLEFLGIDVPQDIDIEAIAQACDATIVYDHLEGCEARIVGVGGKALITVNDKAPRARQRFSAAHELGHWIYDRGRVAFVCAEKQLVAEWGAANPERRANRFAADLLLPRNMVKKRLRRCAMNLTLVKQLAQEFETSLTATAIRFVELSPAPAMLICHDHAGKKRWSTHNHHVPAALKARDILKSAYRRPEWKGSDLRTVPKPMPNLVASEPREVGADCFIAHPKAAGTSVLEDIMPIGAGLVLSLLSWPNEHLLNQVRDEDEPISRRRRPEMPV